MHCSRRLLVPTATSHSVRMFGTSNAPALKNSTDFVSYEHEYEQVPTRISLSKPTNEFRYTDMDTAPLIPFPLHRHEKTPSSKSQRSVCDDFTNDFRNRTVLNHYGAELKVGSVRAAEWRVYMEQKPCLERDDEELLPHLAHSVQCLANVLQVPDRAKVALLPNVTAGLKAIFSRHVETFGNAEAVCIIWDLSYKSVKKMAHQFYGNNVIEIPFLQRKYLDRLQHQTTEAASGSCACTPDYSHSHSHSRVFQDAVDECLDEHRHLLQNKSICFMLDQTTSNTALTLPIAQLATHVKSRLHPQNVTVVVDGAHGLIAQDSDLTRLFGNDDKSCVDVYLTNAHKWFSAPHGVSVMAVANNSDNFFSNTDTANPIEALDYRDYAAALSIPAVYDYWQTHRGSRSQANNLATARDKCNETLKNGIQILADRWYGGGSRVDPENWPGMVTLTGGSNVLAPMTLVRLPTLRRFTGRPLDTNSKQMTTAEDAKRVQDYLCRRHIDVPVKCVLGELYVRVSCHIYNRTEDFQHLATVVNELS